MTVMTKPLRRQQQMNEVIRHHPAEKMVVENETSVDLLYGLLIYISWSHTHRKTKPHLTLMGSLLKSLVYDCVLHKSQVESSNVSFFTNYNCAEPPEKDSQAEARRAVLGAFMVTSIVANNHKRLEALKWTPFLSECLEGLAEQPEWLGDHSLVAMVKYQLSVDQITQTLRHLQAGGTSPPFYFDTLREQLAKIRHQVPVELKSEENIASFSLYAELLLHETTALTVAPCTTTPEFHRHEALSAQLATIRRWLDVVWAIPPRRYWALGFAFWGHFAHVLIALFRLTARASDPAWDPGAVHAVLDVTGVCERLAAGFAEASAEMVHDEDEEAEMDFFLKCHHWMVKLREKWVAEMEATGAARAGAESGDGMNMNTEMDPSMSSLFQSGDDWQTDLFNACWNGQVSPFFQ